MDGGWGSTSHFISQSVSLSLTGPLCFLLMNSLISVLKRTARVLPCLRAAIRPLMVLLTNIWAGVAVTHFHFGFSSACLHCFLCTEKQKRLLSSVSFSSSKPALLFFSSCCSGRASVDHFYCSDSLVCSDPEVCCVFLNATLTGGKRVHQDLSVSCRNPLCQSIAQNSPHPPKKSAIVKSSCVISYLDGLTDC